LRAYSQREAVASAISTAFTASHLLTTYQDAIPFLHADRLHHDDPFRIVLHLVVYAQVPDAKLPRCHRIRA
jgi:hypothetical protein